MKTYLYTIARSRALNYIKREKRIIYLNENVDYGNKEEDIYSIEEEIFSNERKQKLYKAIEELNESQKRAIFLADIEELSYNEIGKILGKSISQTKMIIYRARKNLKKLLGKERMEIG